jgi:predicted Zn-dependent protease
MSKIDKETYEKWKKYFPAITFEQAIEAEIIATKQLCGVVPEGTIERYLKDNVSKNLDSNR